MSVFGADTQNWINAILAFSIFVGPPAVCLAPRSKTKPRTNSVSSIVPPTCFTILTSFRSTFVAVAGSITPNTASNAIGAKTSALLCTTLDARQVLTASKTDSRSNKSTGRAMPIKISSAFAADCLNASAIIVGWIPFDNNSEHACNNAPAMTQIPVVPSPASISCDFDNCTNICAVGWNTCNCDKMVAPSLVINTSPSPFWIILSIPRGPRDVLTVSATALAAIIFDMRTSLSLAFPFCDSPLTMIALFC